MSFVQELLHLLIFCFRNQINIKTKTISSSSFRIIASVLASILATIVVKCIAIRKKFDSHFISGMGTKIEYAINPLAASSTNTNSFDAHHRVDDWYYFQTREVKKFKRTRQDGFRKSMDRMLEQRNIESIKRTMQIQEDIFKHQVQELHRLYSVQKVLMAELKKEIKQSRISSASMASSEMKHSHIYMKTENVTATSGYIFQVQNIPEDPSSREKKGSSQIGNKLVSVEGSDEESEVELTLSIGVSSNKKRSKGLELKETREIDSTASFKSDSGPNTPMSSSSATFDNQEKKMPHWLFGLSIKRG